MKKIVSLMLVFALVCSMISMFNLVSFSAAKDDSAYDCVAYAKARFREIWGFDLHATGLNEYGVYGASGYYYNAASNGDTVSSTPQIGALAIWGGSSANQWGHVAIVENVNGSSVTYSEGGYIPYEGAPKTFNQETRNMSNMSKTNQPFLGYVYIKGTGLDVNYTEKPTNLKVSANYTSVAVGDTVTFTFSADYAEELWFGLHDENGFIYGDRFYTNSTTYTFDKAGKYRANIEAKNNIGSIQSEYIYINVYDSVPSDCKISVDNDAINVGEEMIFNLSSKNANSHWIGIHKEDDTLVYESEAGNLIKCTFNEPGVYYADFDAINGYGTTRSNKVWFTVGKYEITYDSNGGENAPYNQSKKYDENITISSTKPTRDGYTFLGWSTNKNATVAEYSAGSIYSKNEDVTLYAVWQKNPVTVSSISIATTSSKTEYYVGDTFASSGLTVKATMSDGTTQTLTSGFTVSSPNMSTAGTKTVTVTYSGKTAIFTINVKEKPVTPDIPDTNFTISIKEPSRTTIRYNDGIILHANVEGELPENSNVVWYVSNDNFDAGYLDDGMSCVFVSKNNGYTTIYAVLEDANGNELAVDSIEMRSKAGFFDKIGGFFRSLFGSTKIYEI